MGCNRLESCFKEPTGNHPYRLFPYLTAGFPDGETTKQIVCRADALGIPAIELGFPYSDSIADGPVIQSSFHDALAGGFKIDEAFHLVAEIRPRIRCGMIAMVSFSIVHRIGTESFMRRAAESGFDGVILPDVPAEESESTRAAASSANLCHIGLIAPTTTNERRRAIARLSTGFVYQIASAGTTGERTSLPTSLRNDITELRGLTSLPICVGFGISTAQQVREVCQVADGAIVGSALVRRIAEAVSAGRSRHDIVEAAESFLQELLSNKHANQPK